jgi:hypothetical protein
MLIDSLKFALRHGLGEGDEIEKLRLENQELRRQLVFETSRSAEYFHLIERLEAQRNERWEMFLEQSGQHANAQAMLEDQILLLREILRNCVQQLNAFREEKGLEIVKKPADLADPPIGTAAEYRARMNALREVAAAIIEARKERESIQKRHDEKKF